jgi:MFS family permease
MSPQRFRPAGGGVLARYTVAATLARIADGGSPAALVLLALDRTGSAAAGGLLAAAATLPHLVAAPAIGLLSDRVHSVRRLYVSSFVLFGLGLLAVEVLVGRTTIALPLVCAVLAGSVGPLLSGGMTSLLGGLLPAPALPRAFAVDSGTYSAAGIVGPALVAVVAGVASAGVALLVVAAIAVVAGAVFCLLPVPDRSPTDRDLSPRQLVEGAVALWRPPPLRGSTIATTVSFIGTAGVLPVAVALFAGQLGHPASAGGVFLSTFAVGAMVASLLLSARPLRREHAVRTVYVSVLATGLLLAATAASPTYAVALAVFALAGLVDTPMLTATFMIRNEWAPESVRTQVFTTAAGLKIGSSALGSVAAGVAASSLGGAGLLIAAAAVQVVAAAAGALSQRES